MKTKPVNVQDWMKSARQTLTDALARLSPAGQSFLEYESSGNASLEARVLLAHVLQKPSAWILAHEDTPISENQLAFLERLLAQRVSGVPLPYLIGHWEFFGLDFEVNPAVLIPRPETELLVERGLAWLQAHPSGRTADVGTGSGCIAVSLAKNCPNACVLTIDRSRDALELARRNAARQQVEGQIVLVQSDLLSAACGPFDLVCANLPYIPEDQLKELPVAQYEPRLALDGGVDGLRLIQALLSDAHRWLAPESLLLLEMQYDQGEAISALAKKYLPDAEIRVIQDLAGLPRMVEVEKPA